MNRPMEPWQAAHARLMDRARDPSDLATLACAGVISLADFRNPGYRVPVAGLAGKDFLALLQRYFPGAGSDLSILAFLPARDVAPPPEDEFDDLVALFDAHARRGREGRWLARVLATGCMGGNHLWQDMGFPSRGLLSAFLAERFPALARANSGDMKWKKFFYKQLCEQAGVRLCKAPSCGVCVDHAHCFGPEDGAGPGYFRLARAAG